MFLGWQPMILLRPQPWSPFATSPVVRLPANLLSVNMILPNCFQSVNISSFIYLLVKIEMKVSASFEVKMGSGSSLKYCFSMSAMS